MKRLGRRVYREGKNIVERERSPGTPWRNVSRTEKLVDGFALTGGITILGESIFTAALVLRNRWKNDDLRKRIHAKY